MYTTAKPIHTRGSQHESTDSAHTQSQRVELCVQTSAKHKQNNLLAFVLQQNNNKISLDVKQKLL